jgi:hypothetical protein
VTLILIVAAPFVSLNRRRTLAQLDLGSFLALLIVRRLAFRVEDDIVGLIPSRSEAAARTLVNAFIQDPRAFTTPLFVIAFLVAIGAFAWGRREWIALPILEAGKGSGEGTREPVLELIPAGRWIGDVPAEDQHLPARQTELLGTIRHREVRLGERPRDRVRRVEPVACIGHEVEGEPWSVRQIDTTWLFQRSLDLSLVGVSAEDSRGQKLCTGRR